MEAGGLGTDPEVIVVDNVSRVPPDIPVRLGNGISVSRVLLDENRGASARNIGAAAATGEWLVMLDDDSVPTSGGVWPCLRAMPEGVAAVGGEILLPDGRHEVGGLPEVFIGCGAAVRRGAFLSAGGYDASFDYYVEESDLCARLVLSGGRIAHSRALRFEHRKSATNRSFARILFRLVRNNAWVIWRYAPTLLRDRCLDSMLERYAGIARREGVYPAWQAAREEALASLDEQPSRTMGEAAWDRLTGVAAFRGAGLAQLTNDGVRAVKIVAPGKGVEQIEAALADSGIELRDDAVVSVIGTLSPGPMLDGPAGAVRPWSLMNDPAALALR